MNAIEWIKSLIKSQKKHFLTFWLLNLSLTVVSLLVPLMEGNMLNVLVYTRDLAAFQKWILLLAVFVVIQIIIRYFVYKIETIRTNQFILDFNRQVLDCLFRTSTKEVTSYQPTYLHSRLLQDTDSIIHFFFSSVSGLINNSVILVFTALILYRVNPLLLLSIFVFLVIYTLIYSLFKERIRIAFLEQSEASNSCFSTRNHIYQNYLEIKARERIDSAKSFLQKRETSLLRSMLRMFHLRYWLSTTQFTVSTLFQFGGFIVGGLAVMNGHLTMGVFTYLLQYFAMMLNTVEQFFNIGTAYQEYQASKMRLIEVLSMEKDDEGDKILDRIERIELVGLNYRHEEESKNLYEDNVDATFVSGNLTHILGENGVGKSTILLCILGIYHNRQVSGEIKFNGTASSELNMSTLRKNNFSFMIQHPISFEGTVSEYMQSLLTEQEIQQAQDNRDFNQVFVHPQFDLNQIIEQEYDKLSGDEKQLLNLFVCLAKNASVYLLDEPTANVFPKMKESILSLLQKKADAGNIVIVVTHDHNMLSAGATYTLR